MIEQIKQVEEFHKAMGLLVNDFPTIIEAKEAFLRDDLHREEVKEVSIELTEKINLPLLSKEIADLLYVVYGTIVSCGLQNVITDVFNEIHRANMSKLDDEGKAIINGQNGVLDNTRPMGKVLKSKNYSPANVEHLFYEKSNN